MIIRDFMADDRAVVLAMVEDFYNSPAVSHPIPVSYFADVYDEMCGGGSQRVRGLLLVEEERPAGYCNLSFSYSTEAGGPVVLIEEVYIAPDFRGKGLGGQVFEFLRAEYSGKAARLRLEVEPDNTGAIRLYERLGFTTMRYDQMILEDF